MSGALSVAPIPGVTPRRRGRGGCDRRARSPGTAPPYRGVKLYLPGRADIPFFKRFVRDFMALYKFNTLIMEMNGNMRLRRHPEVNSGTVEFARELNYSRRNYSTHSLHGRHGNSTHYDTADGEIL